MFGRIDLLDRRVPTCRPPIVYARVLLVWLVFTQVCTECNASLYLYTSDGGVATFSTVDFMWVNSFGYGYVNGSFSVASFLGNKSEPCTLNSIPTNTGILLVPFDDGLNNGCLSYSDVISSNPWFQAPTEDGPNQHVTDGSANIPPVVIFTSTNNGDPGVREHYGNLRVLSKAKPTLALIKMTAATKAIGLSNETTHAMFSRDDGPWMTLLDSKGLLIWSIVFGTLYGCIAMMAFYHASIGICKHGFVLTNPRPWLLTGVGSSSTIFLVILEYDPWAIRFDRLSELQYEIVQMMGYLILCICYAIFLFPWIKATRNISDELNYRVLLVRQLCRVFLIGLFFAVLIKIIAQMFGLLEFATSVNIMQNTSRVAYIMMESVFTFFVVLTYAIFGMIMILARKGERIATRRNANAQIRRARMNQEIFKSGFLMISLVSSLLFITIHTMFTISLTPTISNFWIARVLDDLSFVSGCLVLVTALQYDEVGKYSHMIYSASSDENATESTLSPPVSRDSSFHNSNNSGTGTGAGTGTGTGTSTEATDTRGKRNTVEILFGRRSLGL